MLARIWKKGNPLTLLGMQIGAVTLENSMEDLKKLKIELLYLPAIALLYIYQKDTKILIRRGTCTPMFIAALSAIAKLQKWPKCPLTDDWIKKMLCVCVCVYAMECYSAIKRSEILPFAKMWIELECIMLRKISQRKTNTI